MRLPQTSRERCAGKPRSKAVPQSVVDRALTESHGYSAAACCLYNVAPPERRELRANLTGLREKGWHFHDIGVNSPLVGAIRRRLVSVVRLPPRRPPGQCQH